MRKPRCIWCLKPVANPGDTCNFECYEQICIVLSRGEPYLVDRDTPPSDLYDQPWYIDPRKEDT